MYDAAFVCCCYIVDIRPILCMKKWSCMCVELDWYIIKTEFLGSYIENQDIL